MERGLLAQELRNTDDFEVEDEPEDSKEKPKGDYSYNEYPAKPDEGDDKKPEGGEDEVPGENSNSILCE